MRRWTRRPRGALRRRRTRGGRRRRRWPRRTCRRRLRRATLRPTHVVDTRTRRLHRVGHFIDASGRSLASTGVKHAVTRRRSKSVDVLFHAQSAMKDEPRTLRRRPGRAVGVVFEKTAVGRGGGRRRRIDEVHGHDRLVTAPRIDSPHQRMRGFIAPLERDHGIHGERIDQCENPGVRMVLAHVDYPATALMNPVETSRHAQRDPVGASGCGRSTASASAPFASSISRRNVRM